MSDVSWSWEADLKDGVLEAFMANVVAPWNATAEADEDTLLNSIGSLMRLRPA